VIVADTPRRETVELLALITCDPAFATPGKYTLNFEVFAFPAGGVDIDQRYREDCPARPARLIGAGVIARPRFQAVEVFRLIH